MCELLFSVLIVGAMESEPGWMTVDVIKREHLSLLSAPPVERVYIPTNQYLACYE